MWFWMLEHYVPVAAGGLLGVIGLSCVVLALYFDQRAYSVSGVPVKHRCMKGTMSTAGE